MAQQPSFNVGTMLLMTDGSVLCHDAGGGYGTSNWWRLAPDSQGSYREGTWSQVASMPNTPAGVSYSPLYFASAILNDGRVFVAGGEYNGSATEAESLMAVVYDPFADAWSTLPTPSGWTSIGDAPCCVLPNGTVLIGSISSNATAIYDPVANVWSNAAPKTNGSSEEESWVLLPENTVLSVDCNGHPQTEKYVIANNTWISAGATPSDLVEAASLEVGPAILLPDGRAFAIGATGKTALYTTQTNPTDPGVWQDGPTFPAVPGVANLGAKDAPACLLPNGRVLCVAGPVDGVSGDYLSPTYFFEFDPVAGTISAVAGPGNSGSPPFAGRMILLPTGDMMFSNSSQDVEIYVTDGAPQDWFRPTLTSPPAALTRGSTYTIHGTQFTGLSQAVAYGDDASMATNYPLVRLVQGSTIVYCRTFNFSTRAVATADQDASTDFAVPQGMNSGSYLLQVVANGIASATAPVTVN
jgi:hypothetical protein